MSKFCKIYIVSSYCRILHYRCCKLFVGFCVNLCMGSVNLWGSFGLDFNSTKYAFCMPGKLVMELSRSSKLSALTKIFLSISNVGYNTPVSLGDNERFFHWPEETDATGGVLLNLSFCCRLIWKYLSFIAKSVKVSSSIHSPCPTSDKLSFLFHDNITYSIYDVNNRFACLRSTWFDDTVNALNVYGFGGYPRSAMDLSSEVVQLRIPSTLCEIK